MIVSPPAEPDDCGPDKSWEHYDLHQGVIDALHQLPSSFSSPLRIEGVLATDLFAFNSSLSTTIEEQVVQSLNAMRATWDEQGKYDLYSFERQAQTFPDVVLRTRSPGQQSEIIFGLELKGWYVLSKEGEPSFRFKTTPAVCAPADLIVIVPWALQEVISGSPMVFSPYIAHARFAAEYRNWWWTHRKDWKPNRRGQLPDREVDLSDRVICYPTKSEAISDRPRTDAGGNFGRYARTGLMASYISDLFCTPLSGIPIQAWQKFFSLFTEKCDIDQVIRRIDAFEASTLIADADAEAIVHIASTLKDLAARLDSNEVNG